MAPAPGTGTGTGAASSNNNNNSNSNSGGGGPAGPGETRRPTERKSEKSYFASAVESINPFTSSRSSSPAPPNKEKDKAKEMPPPAKPARANTQKADDHSINTLYGQSFRRYPPDCPPLNVQWFHAADVSCSSISCFIPAESPGH
jgi:hypothetical protein